MIIQNQGKIDTLSDLVSVAELELEKQLEKRSRAVILPSIERDSTPQGGGYQAWKEIQILVNFWRDNDEFWIAQSEFFLKQKHFLEWEDAVLSLLEIAAKA